MFAWDRQELGPSIGYLPQDVELFEGTVSENISRFGKLDSELVVKASMAADVHDMILRLPEGYDTPIGPAGGALSGGQRQRLGLARALYGDPVLIVLDEPNSSLDDVGEAALTKAIEGIKQRQATVVVISHRPNILGVMDSLMILKDGQLVAFDKREKVMSQLKPQQTVRPINPGSVVPVSV